MLIFWPRILIKRLVDYSFFNWIEVSWLLDFFGYHYAPPQGWWAMFFEPSGYLHDPVIEALDFTKDGPREVCIEGPCLPTYEFYAPYLTETLSF